MADTLFEKTFHTIDTDTALTLAGINDENLKLIEDGLGVTIAPFGQEMRISGSEGAVNLTYNLLQQMLQLLGQGIRLAPQDVVSAVKMAQKGTLEYFGDLYTETLIKDAKGQAVRVKNFGQRQYINAIRHNDITFGIGPAGTGKTYLAVVMAVSALKEGVVDRIILTRPAVEAGENLGFLPGDLKEKVDPYLRPVYDALYAVLGKEHTDRLMDRGVIEIAPLAYMRGRTLENAFAILDEAQNTTQAQMKMFLTRLGFGSKMIVNGDITQIDLPNNAKSGLIQAQKILQHVKGIEFTEFSAQDVVRNPVVARIIDAYGQNA
ncbi:PhoH family protein [Lacticaseibacillus brantae]|uniref:PhoH-like protein n=1 Tax=Lacticaseibacillus brantae DSM 23927 TaxID=1423727 RepID=A0A0R2AZJ0_9LACO|nr:PhoH family protein [Lacticaseibacillus brantae]KRM72702.1 phosphate starvation-inducible protein PhoH, ATPase [Lacticaseibacillus brantae DSM 23927]